MGSRDQFLAISRIALRARNEAIADQIMCLPWPGSYRARIHLHCVGCAVPECASQRIGRLRLHQTPAHSSYPLCAPGGAWPGWASGVTLSPSPGQHR